MPDLKIIFTGSSLLHLQQAKVDLSRRAVMYEMPGLSFTCFLKPTYFSRFMNVNYKTNASKVSDFLVIDKYTLNIDRSLYPIPGSIPGSP